MLVATPGTTPLSLGRNLIPTSFMLPPPPYFYGRPRGIESPRGSTAATNVTVTSTSPRLMYRVRYISETEVQL